MDWITYLVLLLIAAGYILNHLAKRQEQNQPPRRPAPPLDPDAEPRPRRATTQLEKFLEDMQRRKVGEDVRTAEPIYDAVEVPAKPVPPPLPRGGDQRQFTRPNRGERMTSGTGYGAACPRGSGRRYCS